MTAQPSGASTSIRNAITCELMTYDRITDWFGPSGTTFKTHQCVAYGFGVMSKTWCQIDLNYQECGVWGGTSPGCFGI